MATILVVDDDRMIRTLLQRVAMRAGFDVEVAKDGLEALEMLAVKSYDIAIVDLMMPRMSGYELVQAISTMKPRPTVIVATAMMNGDVSTLDDSLVRRVIRKPFDVKAVANALIEVALQTAEERKVAGGPSVVVVNESAVVQEDSKTAAPQTIPSPREKRSS